MRCDRGRASPQLRLLAIAYIAVVLALTLLPIFGVKSDQAPVVHYVPFQSIRDALHHDVLSPEIALLVGNIALFVPLGVLAPSITRRHSLPSALGVGFALSATVELCQLGISLVLGYSYRTADVDDVILNVVGCMAGFFAFRACFERPVS